MDTALTKQFIDSFHIAKHLTDMLPELPDGLTPRHIRILDNIYTLSQHGSAVRISDISDAMRSTRPSITKLVNELNKKGYVEKTPDTDDKRVILVSLTPLGRDVYEVYGLRYHEWLSQLLEPIADEDIEAAIRAIRYANKLMSAVSPDISKLHNAGTPQSDK